MSVKKILAPNTILVAIDGSLPAQMSARAAVQIAKKMSLNIRGLYVVGARTILEGDHNYKTELNINTEPTIDELMKQFKSQATEALDWLEELCFSWGVPVTTDVFFGGIPEMILDDARRNNFLAIGRRGHVHHDNVYALGENFRNIATHLHVPILIGGDLPTSFKRLYLIFSDHINTQNLIYWGNQFHVAFSSNILVSIYGNNETHIDIPPLVIEQLSKEARFSYEQVEGKIQSGSDIVVAARDHQVDMILMEGYRRIALGLWVEKHPLEEVLLNCETMVLAV
jgi:nucleotide-binding universal stress UspA family protein